MGSEPREVMDAEGVAWTCIQAFAGLGNDPERQEPPVSRVPIACRSCARPLAAPVPAASPCRPDWAAMEDSALVAAIRDGADGS
jgi:hypothetical protein